VLLTRGDWYQTMHQLETPDREEANPPDHQNAVDYGEQHGDYLPS